ncbi:MAG: zinc ribbon domain-containing protein [Lentisphaerae bacterium]|jgi:putative FmdB family regulatory protein|nr:zinc ribbon domain-containing protein [Lentisphaerota bacterium]
MPTYEYSAENSSKSCPFCKEGFEHVQRLSDAPLTQCPRCGAPVRKCISLPSIGRSQSGLDDRARQAGFKKLKKIGRGEYEKQF